MLWRADGRKAAFIGAGGLFLSDKITSGHQSSKINGNTFGSLKTLKSGRESTKLEEGSSASSLMITAFISFCPRK